MRSYTCVNDIAEARRFVQDMKVAIKRANETGGGYSAFLHDDTGEAILQVEIAPKVRPKT